ncbi:bifunctional methylenetetrahydrofolate dehydrogenase/methenyltetrahydrofolate cyclohydrolase, partial [Stenotrophomonas maltophilia]
MRPPASSPASLDGRRIAEDLLDSLKVRVDARM